jgi:hypothetical protein
LCSDGAGELCLLGGDGLRQAGVERRERVGLGERRVEALFDLRGERLLLRVGGVELAEPILDGGLIDPGSAAACAAARWISRSSCTERYRSARSMSLLARRLSSVRLLTASLTLSEPSVARESPLPIVT